MFNDNMAKLEPAPWPPAQSLLNESFRSHSLFVSYVSLFGLQPLAKSTLVLIPPHCHEILMMMFYELETRRIFSVSNTHVQSKSFFAAQVLTYDII